VTLVISRFFDNERYKLQKQRLRRLNKVNFEKRTAEEENFGEIKKKVHNLFNPTYQLDSQVGNIIRKRSRLIPLIHS
jgi:predicted methyltransferase